MITTAEQFRNVIEAIVKGKNPDHSVTKKHIRAFLDGNKEESKKCLDFLEEDLTCPICVEVVNEPVITSCHHIFCKYCLAKWMQNDRNSKDSRLLTCPACRTTVALPKTSKQLEEIVETVLKKHGQGKRPPKVDKDPPVKQRPKKSHTEESSELAVIRLMYALR